MKIRVSHILVKHEYEAQDLLRAINSGKEFAELAKKFSTCPSAPSGGDLGIVGRGRLDEDFEDVAFALKIGEITSRPIRTRFGYHLIYRTE